MVATWPVITVLQDVVLSMHASSTGAMVTCNNPLAWPWARWCSVCRQTPWACSRPADRAPVPMLAAFVFLAAALRYRQR
jgi:hypothetical protein